MDSPHLRARHVVAQHPLPTRSLDLYRGQFQSAFRDGRTLDLQDLVSNWPFEDLHLQQLVGHLELDLDRNYGPCIEAIIQGVVAQLRRELEEPDSDSRCQLRMLDMTGVPHDPYTLRISLTKALAKACVELSKHQKELQRHQTKRHKGRSRATMAPPQLLHVDVHTDLLVKRSFWKILRDALKTGASGPLSIKCREFKAWGLSAKEIVTLLESLDQSCLWRVHLQLVTFTLPKLSEITPHLLRFPELCSVMIPLFMLDLRTMTPELTMRIHGVAAQLGMLPGLRELSLGMMELSGNLHQFLCYLKAPLESLVLDRCSLIPADLKFLSQSFHAPALKKLDLHGNDIPRGLLEPLLLLLEKASASLLCLDLKYCDIADSHLAVLLPTLLHCSNLRFLRLDGNPLSTAALKDLLQKTLELPNLRKVVYPIPVDCRKLEPSDCRWPSVPDEERFAAVKVEFSQILVNSGRTDFIWTHDQKDDQAMDYFSL